MQERRKIVRSDGVAEETDTPGKVWFSGNVFSEFRRLPGRNLQ